MDGEAAAASSVYAVAAVAVVVAAAVACARVVVASVRSLVPRCCRSSTLVPVRPSS